jgi:hypothetical protein
VNALDPVAAAQAALNRCAKLLRVLDREHTAAELYTHLRGVRHEVESAQTALSRLGADIAAPRAGSARSGDPETSQAAARAIRTRSGSQRHDVLGYLANCPDGAADFQTVAALRMIDSSARTRRHELLQAGYVQPATAPVDTDGELGRAVVTRVRPETGLACIVWEISPKGRAALNRLNSGQMVMALVDEELTVVPPGS